MKKEKLVYSFNSDECPSIEDYYEYLNEFEEDLLYDDKNNKLSKEEFINKYEDSESYYSWSTFMNQCYRYDFYGELEHSINHKYFNNSYDLYYV